MIAAPLPANEPARLDRLRRLGVLDTPPEPAYDDFVAIANDLCGTPMAAISLVDADRQWFKSCFGLPILESSRDVSFCSHTLHETTLLEVSDATQDPRFADSPFTTEYGVRFYAGAPLRTEEGLTLGTLCVLDTEPRVLTEAQRDGLTRLARQITERLDLRSALERRQSEATRRHDMLWRLHQVQDTFIATQQTREAFAKLLDLLLETTQSEYGFLGEVLYEPDGTPWLKSHAITNIAWSDETRAFYEENEAKGLEFRNLRTLFGHVMTTGKAVVSNAPARDPRRGGLPPGHPPMHAFLGLPILLGNELIGMAGLANRPGGYDQDLIEELEPLLLTYGHLIQAHRLQAVRLEAEASLRDSERRFQRVIAASGLAYWDLDVASGAIHGDWFKLLGFDDGEVDPSLTGWMGLIHPDDASVLTRSLEQTRLGARPASVLEFRMLQKSGAYRWFRSEGGIVRSDSERQTRIVSGTLKDIDDRKRAEQQDIQIQRNRTLLQEVHHRVKNNLQSVSSLLGLQQRETADPRLADQLQVSRNRISAISLLHELLYRSDNLQAVPLDTLLHDLAHHMFEALGVPARIRLEISAESCPLEYGRAGSLAIILNELITNAVKHAFPSGASGTIRVNAHRTEDQSRLRVRVEDSGRGLQEPAQPRTRGSLGLVLVRRLTQQLEGTFEYRTGDTGTTWVLEFPLT